MATTRERRSAPDPGVSYAGSVADGGDCLSDLGVFGNSQLVPAAVFFEVCLGRIRESEP